MPGSRPDKARLWERLSIHGTYCFVGAKLRGGCGGRCQLHHLVPKTTLIRSYGISDEGILWDERNLISVCEKHHSRLHHGASGPGLTGDQLREEAWAFAREHGAEGELERRYGSRLTPP